MSHAPSFLVLAVVFLSAAVIMVPLFHRLGIGAVIGYLVAGILIGPSVLNLIPKVEDILHFSEIGVVLLLFLIGLELNPTKLWSMRRSIFGVGLSQTVFTTLAGLSIGLLLGFSWQISLAAAMALSLSSTAIALQVLKEKKWLPSPAGQTAFAVLLFQDLAVIPMLAMLPLLGEVASGSESSSWLSFVKSVGAILAVVFLGRYLIRPILRTIASSALREILTAFSLLLVLGISLLMSLVGLSMALGTFLAGVLLAESEYRHEIEMDLEPFKGLLLGLFFMSVGMSMNLSVLTVQPFLILGLVILLLGAKGIINFGISRAAGLDVRDSLIFSITLSQGGEFAFVLFGLATQLQIFPEAIAQPLSLAVAISMISAPLLIVAFEKIYLAKLAVGGKLARRDFDAVENEHSKVIIAGYGRFGQMVGRVLHSLKVPITVLDADPNQIEIMRKFGWKAFYGDATRMDLLEASGIATAQILVIAIDDMDASLRIIEQVKERWPQVKIISRTRNRATAFDMMAQEVQVVREVASASVEMAEKVLGQLGYGRHEAFQISRKFYNYDLKMMEETAPHAQNQAVLISTAFRSKEALMRLMEKDEKNFRDEDHPDAWS